MIPAPVRVAAFLSFKTILRRPWLFLLITLIIAFGFLNAIFFNAFLTGMGETMNDQLITKNFGNVIIEPRDGERYITNAGALMDKIRRVPGVEAASRRYLLGASLQTENRDRVVSAWMFQAIDPQDERTVTSIEDAVTVGSYLSPTKNDEIMVGSHISGGDEQGFMPQDETLESTVGDKIHVRFDNGVERTYRIGGIVDARDFFAVMSLYITLDEAEDVLGIKDQASMIVIRTMKGQEQGVITALKRLGVQENIRTWKDKSATTNLILRIFDTLKNTFTVIGFLVVFITVYLVINITLIHRRKQIGILKSVGISKANLVLTYVSLSLIYTIGGILLGSLLLWLLTRAIQQQPIDSPMGFLVPVVTVYNYAFGILLLIGAAVVGGLIPSLRSVKKNIIELLRS